MIESEEQFETSGPGAARPEAAQEAAAGRRKSYTPPGLVEWGTMTELTRGGSGIDIDYDFITTKAV